MKNVQAIGSFHEFNHQYPKAQRGLLKAGYEHYTK
jgi:hypothetical protein